MQRRHETMRNASVRAQIMELISQGRLGPGTKLPTERVLAEVCGAPRSAIRDEMAVLEAEGIVIRKVGSGTFLSALATQPSVSLQGSIFSPSDLMEARILIEPQMARLVVKTANGLDIARMEECNRLAEDATNLQDFERWDGELHKAIADSTHNDVVIRVFETMNSARNNAEWGDLKRASLSPQNREKYEAEHRNLVTAIKNRNAEHSFAIMLDHLLGVRFNLLGI